MFFDNKKYFEFVKLCRQNGINIPIIPGIEPITSLKQIQFLPRTFHMCFPDDLSDALEGCKTDKDVTKIGIEWGAQQSLELKENGVPCLHYGPIGSRTKNCQQSILDYCAKRFVAATTYFPRISNSTLMMSPVASV